MCCSSGKNQTNDLVFETIAKAGLNFRSEEIRGVGIFEVPAPEIGILEYKTVHVDGLTYHECMKRGANCNSFQWIALGFDYETEAGVLTFSTMREIQDHVFACNKACGSSCPMGCTCFTGDTRCRTN